MLLLACLQAASESQSQLVMIVRGGRIVAEFFPSSGDGATCSVTTVTAGFTAATSTATMTNERTGQHG